MNANVKRLALIGSLLCALTVFWSWQSMPERNTVGSLPSAPISMCGSFSLNLTDTILAKPKILDGLGDLHYPVTTVSLQAQSFFEQGLRMVYGFNHWEAIQSFREATRLDPEFAMGYWGLALAYGPNLNDVNPQDRERIAFEAIQKAQSKKGHVSPVEKELIDAMAARYNGKAYAVRDSLNFSYAEAMRIVAQHFPNDPEVQTLFADAVMNTMPWDYWEKNGEPKTATAEAKTVLEKVIAAFPRHPGAHHLYIHLVEASPTPALGLKSAAFLETAMPAAGHIVHMPSHIYVRTGDYAKSIVLNTKAVEADEKYLSASENQGYYRLMYYPHNIDFICHSSYLDGRSKLAIQTALKMAYKGQFSIESAGPFAQYMIAEPMIAFTRFGKWEDILSLPDPGASMLYPQVLWRFSRGMALLRTGFTPEAKQELTILDSLSRLDTLKSMYITFNPVSKVAEIARELLKGEILLKEKKYDDAVQVFGDAVRIEDDMRYNEPPEWKIPTRHFLGAALLEAGKLADAEKVYLEDLKRNPENGWSLMGLQRAQYGQTKKEQVVKTAKRFTAAWKNADVTIVNSRF